MSVACSCNVFAAGVVFDGKDGFSDSLAGVRTDDVAAENLGE